MATNQPTNRLAAHGVPNARFWTFENDGWVKLTLKPGQTLQHYRSWNNGEGSSFAGNTWEHAGDGVRNDWHHGGRDCDGFTESSGTVIAEIGQLRAVEAYGDDAVHNGARIMVPEWSKYGEVRCRDEYAEAAGY